MRYPPTTHGGSSVRDWLFSYLERQPPVVSFGAMNLGPDPHTVPPRRTNVPDGYQVDPSHAALHQRAERIAVEKGVSFAEAVAQAQAGL